MSGDRGVALKNILCILNNTDLCRASLKINYNTLYGIINKYKVLE